MFWRVLAVFLAIFFAVLAEEPSAEPSLRIMAKSRVWNVGERKAIYCEGVNLQDKINWYDPTDNLVETRSINTKRIYVGNQRDESSKTLVPLIIQRLRLEDSGNWTCKSGELSESIDIIVGEKVVFDKREESYEGDEGKTARIECEAKGSPKPTMQWYKDETPITADSKKYYMFQKGDKYTLEIKNTDHLDTGVYKCKFTQKQLAHCMDKRIKVTISHKPLMIDAVTQEFIYDRFRTVEIYAILNETKNITCLAKANPAPKFTWVKKHDYNEEIKDVDTVFNSEDGSSSVLMLRMFNKSFLAEYQCTASNPRGSVSTVFHVTLGNKPPPPDHVNVVNATADTVVFNVTCSECYFDTSDTVADKPDNLPVLGYSFQLVPAQEGYDFPDWNQESFVQDQDIVFTNDTIFEVDNLPNKTRFFARVRSRNAAGYSTWLDLEGLAETTDLAAYFVSSTTMILATFLLTQLG